MKLELKHLAPYLPYGLKVEVLNYKCNYVGKQYGELYSLEQWSKCGKLWSCDTGGAKTSLEDLKPILRPLSDLTKEITVNGETFVPYFIIQQLLEWHFDIFGLIENGLAIDINTLDK